MSNVLETTVKYDLCAGCGLCAGICPKNALTIQWNTRGEYNPVQTAECNNCGLCVKSCPFSEGTDNEDTIGNNLFGTINGIHHLPETGFYLSSYVGHVTSEEQRMNSASGGLATWFLETLLTRNIVDSVICVEHSYDGKRLFKYTIAKTIEYIRRSAGSSYYPNEISEVIRYIRDTPGRYAVIGLPCFVKGLRLAQQTNKTLRERVIIIAGLTCGKMKNTNFTKYIANISGLDEEIKEVSFRCKSLDRPANNFFFNFTGVSGKNTHFFWGGELSRVWSSSEFTLPACEFCDDIFAECADITFMDAWLPEYTSDSRGTSLCIVRSELAANILQENDGIVIEPISIQKVIASQRGVILNKREMLSCRLASRKKSGTFIPKKRVSPAPFGGLFIILKRFIMRCIALGLALFRKIRHRK